MVSLPTVNQDPNWAAQLNTAITDVETLANAAQASADAKVPTSRLITAGTGLTGGGDLSADRTLTVAYGTTAGTAAQGNDTRITTAVPNTRLITAGTGLTGGGDLSADRTLTVAYGATSTTACVGDDARLSDTRIPTDNSVTSAKIVDGAIVNDDINAAAGIVLSKLAVDPLARANHTGTQLASTVSDFNAAVATTAFLATGGTVTGNLDVSGRALGVIAPRNHNLIAWSYDPSNVTQGATVTNGTVYLVQIAVNRSLTASRIYWGLNAAAVTPTAAQNWVGLYDSTGTRLATVDVTAKTTSTGLQNEVISQAVTPGLYWLGMVFNAATPPQPYRSGGLDVTLVNVGLTASTARYATNGVGQTTLPASITPASNTIHHLAWWLGLG